MNLGSIKSLLIVAIVCYVVFLLLYKKFSLIESVVFLIPFQTLGFELGLWIWPYYLPLLGCILTLLLRKKKTFINTTVLVYFVYICISTIIISLFFIDFNFVNGRDSSFFRNNGRFISYLVKIFIFQLGLLFVVSNTVNDKTKFIRILKAYLHALVILSSIGLLQLFVFLISGYNIIPLRIVNGISVEPMVKIFSGLSFPRTCSLGGEPKGLAASLAVGIAILYYSKRYKLKIVKHYKLTLGLFVVVLFSTVSTGGIGLIVILSIYVFLNWLVKSIVNVKFSRGFLFIACLIPVLMMLGKEPLTNLVQTRFIDRPIGAESDDATIQAFLKDNPKWWLFGPGSGNIHQLASPYIPKSAKRFSTGNILNSRYGHIKILSENGIVGLFLFLLIYIVLFYKLVKSLSFENKSEIFFLLNTLIVLVLFYFARANYVYPPLLFLTGLGLAYRRIIIRSNQLNFNIN